MIVFLGSWHNGPRKPPGPVQEDNEILDKEPIEYIEIHPLHVAEWLKRLLQEYNKQHGNAAN